MKSIIFSTEEVQAILDGRKTQTRRVINYGLYIEYTDTMNEHSVEFAKNYCDLDDCTRDIKDTFIKYHGKYKVDDILYVKETFIKCYIEDKETILFKADNHTELDGSDLDVPWSPSIHLKEKDARIFLKVTNIRVERLQDANEYDIFNEGFFLVKMPIGNKIFINNWNKKAKDGYKWEDNPYVFVYEFERVERRKKKHLIK